MAGTAKSFTLFIDDTLVDLRKKRDGVWELSGQRVATTAERSTYSAKQITATSHTGVKL